MDVYATTLVQDDNVQFALLVLLLGSVSYALGRSGILFANRISGRRFLLSLGLSITLFISSVLFWTFSVWLIADLAFGVRRPFTEVLTVVSTSYAPYIFGFLIILPYLGTYIEYLLNALVLLALLGSIQVVFGFGFWEALACGLLGWGVLSLVTRFSAVITLERWLWRKVSGQPQLQDTQELVDAYVARVRAASSGAADQTSGRERG